MGTNYQKYGQPEGIPVGSGDDDMSPVFMLYAEA